MLHFPDRKKMGRKKNIRRLSVITVLIFIIFANTMSTNLMVYAEEQTETQAADQTEVLEVESPSCILVEASTGQVLFEKNCDEAMAPASVTKVMTLLLAFEAIEAGQMTLDDIVTVSEHAASMGGSQCFFEAGEEQTVEDMIKCIIIASGNDAAVAMAEKVAGSEEAFVKKMNERAAELGMTNASFKNACGLDADGHKMSARDISIMSRELITKYPAIFDYSGIWMDSIIHKTRRGESQFDLVNTNKFLNMYTGATGLKTGFTNTAKYCMSATAERDGIQLIAVIMGADTKDIRNKDACRLLDYGYSMCQKYTDLNILQEKEISIDNGTESCVTIKTDSQFTGILLAAEHAEDVKKKLEMRDPLTAPVDSGEELGKMSYYIGERCIGSVPIYAVEKVDSMSMKYAFVKVLKLQFTY